MPLPRISLIHPTSNPNSRNAALAFSEKGLLQELITTMAYNPESTFGKVIKRLPEPWGDSIVQELGRRTWVAPQGSVMRSHPWQEILRVGLTKTRLNQCLGQTDQGLVDWVYASLDRHVARHHLDGQTAVYAYEDAAATTFEAARRQGIRCFYDLPIAFYLTSRAIQSQEAAQFPELAPALQAVREPAWKLERKDQEVQLADHIFVASSMTRRSLLDAGVPLEKISVIPYGAPIDYFHPQPKTDAIFRALFVGRVGPRKGVHYLLPAWQSLKLPNAELLLVGVNEFPEQWLVQHSGPFRHIPSAPHASLAAHYNSADVFVFPSLVEGFGLVLLEAMACGLPIITTPNTAGPDIITDGVEGFVVPIRDIEALKQRLEWCYRHPNQLAEMGRAARHKAEQLTWAAYRQNLVQQISTLL